MKGSRKYVKWSSAEADAVVEALVLVLFEQPEISMGMLEKAMQRVLPSERHKPAHSLYGEKSAGIIKRALEAYLERVTRPADPTVPLVIEREVPAPERPIIDVLREASAEMLLLACFERVRGFMAPLAVSVRAPEVIRPPAVKVEKQPEKVRGARVVVIGLLPAQQREVEARTKGFGLELRFFDNEKSPRCDVVCDWVVIHCRHTSHAWDAAVKKLVDPSRVKMALGGVGEVCKALADIHARR